MKIFKKVSLVILALIALLFMALYFLLFSGAGNNIIKPYVEKYIKDKTNYDVKFNKFDINFGDLDISANLNNDINADINGTFSIFSQKFDMDYLVSINSLDSFKIKLDEKMNLQGQIRGNVDKFGVNGSGKFLDSNMRFLVNLVNKMPQDIEIDAKNLNLKKALALANMPQYIDGSTDIYANIKTQNGTQNGLAKITAPNLLLNSQAFKDQNITIPSNLKINANSDINVTNSIFHAKTDVYSDIATLNMANLTYDMANKTLDSDFIINVANLEKLEPFIKQKIQGTLAAAGNFKMVANKLEFVNSTIKGFGGEITALLKDNNIDAEIKNIKAGELLAIGQLPTTINGVINGTAKINQISNMNQISGSASLKLENGTINEKELAKLTTFALPKNFSFNINNDIKIQNQVFDLTSNLASNLINMPNLTLKYNLTTKDADAKFSVNIDDLSKIHIQNGSKLNGSIKTQGDLKLQNNQLASMDVTANTAGGTLSAKGSLKDLDILTQNMDMEHLFAIAAQESPLRGIINLNAKINASDFKNINGKAIINIPNSTLNKSYMDKLTGKNFPNGVKVDLKTDVNIKNSIASFNSNINSTLANLNKFSGTYSINNAILNAIYTANIPDLSKLSFYTNRKLKGAVDVNGDIKFHKSDLSITANSDIFGGKLQANIINDNAKATLKTFQIKGLTDMLDLNHFYDGVGNLDLNYNLKSQKGKFNTTINNGKLVSKGLLKAVSGILGRDLSREVYNDGYVNGNMNMNLIDFKAHMKAQKSELNVEKGTFDSKTSQVDIPISANLEKTDLQIHITGNANDPKYTINSNYLKGKINKELGRGIDKLFGTKEGDDNATKAKKQQQSDDVKGIIKGIESLF